MLYDGNSGYERHNTRSHQEGTLIRICKKQLKAKILTRYRQWQDLKWNIKHNSIYSKGIIFLYYLLTSVRFSFFQSYIERLPFVYLYVGGKWSSCSSKRKTRKHAKHLSRWPTLVFILRAFLFVSIFHLWERMKNWR